jgi:hypothetical protein
LRVFFVFTGILTIQDAKPTISMLLRVGVSTHYVELGALIIALLMCLFGMGVILNIRSALCATSLLIIYSTLTLSALTQQRGLRPVDYIPFAQNVAIVGGLLVLIGCTAPDKSKRD